MRKLKAIELLGGTPNAAATAIGVTTQAISQWPDDLPQRIADRVQAALWRMSQKEKPELAPAPTSQGQEATQPVAPQPDALREGVVRRQEVRRMGEIVATVADRRVNEEFAQLPVVPVDPAAPIDSQGV